MAKQGSEKKRAIESLVLLRRFASDGEHKAELEPVVTFLEDLVGPTVTRADAARLLGVSHTALGRWIEKGDLPAVMTPEGRSAVPLIDIIDLVDRMTRPVDDGRQPPTLASIMRDRRRHAAAISEDEFLPPRRRKARTHRAPELHSLAYHRLVAARLDEQVVRDASKRLRRWQKEGRIDEPWAEEWERVLSMPLERVRKVISADSQSSRALRQSSPFAGALNEHERRRVAQAVEERVVA